MSSSEIRVSVIIAAHNAAGHIDAAIASALAQSERGIEVVVGDDGSTDATAERVFAWAQADARVRLLRLPRNRGPSAARNEAIAAARGTWLAVLDADDRFHPDRLRRLVEAADATGADVVADNIQYVDPETGREIGTGFPVETGEHARVVTAEEFVLGSLFLKRGFKLGYLKPVFNAAFLRSNGIRYEESIRIGEDYAFCLDCLIAGAKLVLTGEPLYRYSLTPGSLSRQLSEEDLRLMLSRNAADLARPQVASRPPLRRALEVRQRSIEANLRFMHFVAAFKGRRLLPALRHALLPTPLLGPIASSGKEAVEKRWRRLVGRRGVSPG